MAIGSPQERSASSRDDDRKYRQDARSDSTVAPTATATTSAGAAGDGYQKTTELGVVRPRARGQSTEDHNASMQRHLERRDGRDNNPVSGNRYATTTQVGVETNMFGIPQYELSERSATSEADDKNQDGYSDFYDKYPSSTISPEQGKAQNNVSKVLSLLMGPIGLGMGTLTRLQAEGFIPGSVDLGSVAGDGAAETGNNVVSRTDRQVNRILKNPRLSDEQKAKKINDAISGAAAASGVEGIQEMAAAAFSGSTAEDAANRPGKLVGDPMTATANFQWADPNAAGTIVGDVTRPTTATGYTPATVQAGQVDGIAAKAAQGYTAATTAAEIARNGQATAQQGTVSQNALVDAEQIDVDAAANGQDAVGKALNDYARQGMQIIDTSTVSGKLLAQQLGEGNYLDSKATMQGQMELLSQQFVGPNGEPKIPSWAAGTARNVSKIAAFSGMTGTAATAAMSQAIMEASLPMAQQDAAFFQTLTVQNLNNKQQMTINKANVLARFAEVNLDARMTAAVTNAQSFLQMDLANLENRQQAEIVNTQARVQSILEDAKAKNAARMFSAEAQNDFTKFYDNLNTQIQQFNVSQRNAMEQFNAGESNDAREFQIKVEEQRDQFYTEMQYNVDLANARWRQTVETTNTAAYNEAAKQDVQNLFNLSSEALNQLWDREDAILDYAWKSGESAEQRKVQIYQADKGYELQKRQIENEEDMAFGQGVFEFGKWAADIALGDNDNGLFGEGGLFSGGFL